MMRATAGDLPDILAFLGDRDDKAMFQISNLLRFGLDADVPKGTSCWIRRNDGHITDVLAVTNDGVVMPVCPNGPMTAPLLDRQINVVIGPAEDCRPLIAALDLSGPVLTDRDEPRFTLDLGSLVIPDGCGEIVPLRDAPPQVRDWFSVYLGEVLNAPPDEAATKGLRNYHANLTNDDCVVLMDGATPLAMANLNARLDSIVQVGGVYTPPALRGAGHARRCVALLLAKVRAEGVARATLFAASDSAARAYVAIGFQKVGEWTLLVREEP